MHEKLVKMREKLYVIRLNQLFYSLRYARFDIMHGSLSNAADHAVCVTALKPPQEGTELSAAANPGNISPFYP